MASLFDFTDDTDWIYNPAHLEFTAGGVRALSGFDGVTVAVTPRIVASITDIRRALITMTEHVGYSHGALFVFDGPLFTSDPATNYEYVNTLTSEGWTAVQLVAATSELSYVSMLSRVAQQRIWPDLATLQIVFLIFREPSATIGILNGFEFTTGAAVVILPGEPDGTDVLEATEEIGYWIMPDFPVEPTFVTPTNSDEFIGGYRATHNMAEVTRRVFKTATWANRTIEQGSVIYAFLLAHRTTAFIWQPLGDIAPSKWVAGEPIIDAQLPAPMTIRCMLVEVFPT